jgi:hypothetical protein
MADEIRLADFVLVVASARYRDISEGRLTAEAAGRGVRWEGRLLQAWQYADPEEGMRRIVPVVLPGDDAAGLCYAAVLKVGMMSLANSCTV